MFFGNQLLTTLELPVVPTGSYCKRRRHLASDQRLKDTYLKVETSRLKNDNSWRSVSSPAVWNFCDWANDPSIKSILTRNFEDDLGRKIICQIITYMNIISKT